ncbi:hypothetical protein A3A93_01940 [Candidatus Roizmanbacteria bacterium RIFCSPLOWO2_01_FULL_38_12]|uniref:Uncharacterized protein n=1 Tax=Candidatus Roizmanbacteria bacterium RIFCSPLOWO2_01_FULL_38_12 TaxID=1802061 RepID=A0A1F7IXY2_9BACT|nr:MAG: hypothetical protein A2861_01460 [Candidatus Roizmanbacteria bacterium RIFCSPHIGHO2_01_FULL_38_15]OGK35287.1 MAG: hypothetical protein A3F59_02865 [Candidatus Roizmanbacteria bacterium RIFCSPHIGHO2_12_FULL_38_13]OGK48213.1 MAG: hypothetical protein A3A93_01940 [Candidatus Roizmanbacteria bacterium RIFCSPLOWO2_01_FULL_38_12]
MKTTIDQLCRSAVSKIGKDIHWLKYAKKIQHGFLLKKYEHDRFEVIHKIFAKLKNLYPAKKDRDLAHHLSLEIHAF